MGIDAASYPELLNNRVSVMLSLIDVPDNAAILDFGCQTGNAVEYLRQSGLNACGFDIGDNVSEGHIRSSTVENYRIPWPDASFDIVFSHHVFEHVLNPGQALAELRRVLKPDGVMLHVFPSKWRIFEAHYYTPFGGVLNWPSWCIFWGWLKKPSRRHIPMVEYGRMASTAINTEMHYPGRNEILGDFSKHFHVVESAAVDYLQALKGWKVPRFFDYMISEFHVRVLVCRP